MIRTNRARTPPALTIAKSKREDNMPKKSLPKPHSSDKGLPAAIGAPAIGPCHLPKGKVLTIPCEEGGDTGLATAKSVLSPVYAAAQVLDSFGENHFGEHYSFMASIKTLTEKAELVKAGKMDEAEAMLFAQASALNLLFADLSRRAAITSAAILTLAKDTYGSH